MDIWIFVVPSIPLVWIIFYQFYSEKWKAAAEGIKSNGFRKTVKTFLKISYVVSLVAVVFIWVFRIASLFSNKVGKA